MKSSLAEFAQTWWIRHQRSPLRVARWLLSWLLMGTAMLLLTPLALAARLAGVRFLGINTARIGHLAAEPDCFAKERLLGLHRGIRPFACAPAGKVANAALLDCWRPHIRWIGAPWLCALLKPLEWHPLLAFNVSSYTAVPKQGGGCGYIALARRWNGRDPVLALPPAAGPAGAAALRQLGLPEGAWFVCVHNRGGGYAAHDEAWHAYRNCAIDTYLPAMERIAEAGGWCIRIGDASLAPLPPARNAIDYAHHPLKSDWLDLYLLAHCRFFLGNSSGPFLVAALFNRPVALANMIPIEAVLPYGARDLGIPKLLQRDGRTGCLSFAEMFSDPSSRYHFSAQFAQDGLRILDNSPAEIRALAEEMLQRLDGSANDSAQDAHRQARFRQLLRPQHVSYGSASRIGRDFLARHQDLLP